MTNRRPDEVRRRIAAAQLYLIAGPPASSGENDLEAWLLRIRGALAGGVEIVQLRFKQRPTSEVVQAAQKLKPFVLTADAVLIVNDDLDAALAAGADGVHLGQGDLPIEAARARVGRDYVVGVSTHSLEQAQAATRRGADHLGFGAMFDTVTKDAITLVGPERLRAVVERIPIPVFAIGGIRLANLDTILATGARRIAVSSAILDAPDPKRAARELREALRLAAPSS